MMCFGLWWIMPLACLVMMIGMVVLMGALGGMRCMPRRGAPDRSASRAGTTPDRSGRDIPA